MIFLLRQYFKSKVLRWKLARIERENNALLRENKRLLERHMELKEEAEALLKYALTMEKHS